MKSYFCLLLWITSSGCTFRTPGLGPPDGGEMGLPGDGDMSGGGGASGGDMAHFCNPGATFCADSNTLQTCKPDGSGWMNASCSLGCSSTSPEPDHCKQFRPTQPVSVDDLDPTGLVAPATGTGRLFFDSATGAIINPASPTPALREANADPIQRQVVNGIAFRRTNGKSIWTFAGLTISANAVPSFPAVIFGSSDPSVNNAVALLSTTDINISGIIDARGYPNPSDPNDVACGGTSVRVPGPGGGAGGVGSMPAAGDGAGGIGTANGGKGSGGGGGGYGDTGGVGGSDSPTGGGTAGAKFALSTIVGGSGGGAGNQGVDGGGGGGSIQLVAMGSISISGGGINAGGCPGLADINKKGGGGGGSGGGILLEAFGDVSINGGILAANGGGGGGGGGGTDGQPGTLSGTAALGGVGLDGGNGGNGGGANAIKGGNGGTAAGGGGATGRIRINTRTGTANLASASVLSPRESDGAASQGLVDIH